MIINNKFKIAYSELIELLIGVLFLIGINTWFTACDTSETVMRCHWAEEVITVFAGLILALSTFHILVPDEKIKLGLDFALLAIGAAAIAIPNHVIQLCMMDSMQCRATMLPWTIAFSSLTIVVSVVDGVFYYSTSKKNNK